jgi:hypothetical protein
MFAFFMVGTIASNAVFTKENCEILCGREFPLESVRTRENDEIVDCTDNEAVSLNLI